jgi:abequosyltransferase
MKTTPTTSAPRRPGQPRISLTIPTFNRASYLAETLEAILPQFTAIAPEDAELIISDNCSPDNTAEVVASFRERGLRIEYIRNETNIGSDGNFAQCLRLARGQYCWVMGDDDILLPGAIPSLLSLLDQVDVDMVYLSSTGFSGNFSDTTLVTHDQLNRYAELVTDGEYFLEKVNALIGLISVLLVNKNALEAIPHPPIESLRDTNLMQTGWLFPLIHRRMRVLYVWERPIAYRLFNSGGWGICEVFGVRLQHIAAKYFTAEPQLAEQLMNGVLRYWLCNSILSIREGNHAEMNTENFAADIRHLFANNWRFWVFVWPVAELPFPLAKAIHKFLAAWNKFTRITQGLARHWLGHPTYLTPQIGTRSHPTGEDTN